MTTYDVAVIGLGIVGASALDHLAGEGVRAIGLDAFGPTHGYGSSRGESRIFRRAYWEGATYLPLLDRAHELWTALQDECDEPILVNTGGVFAGRKETGVVGRSRETAQIGAIPHEILDAKEVRARFPAFQLPEDMEAIYEPGAYMVLADRARLALLNRAVQRGAEARFGLRVAEIAQKGDSTHSSHSRGAITVTTHTGQSFSCGALVVATGPWMAAELVPEVRPLIRAMRVPIYWFRPAEGREADYDVGRFPVFLHESPTGKLLYGCPNWDGGVKIGFHNWQQVAGDPSMLDRTVSEAFRSEIASHVREIFPTLDPVPVRARICYYTMSNDGNFILGTSRAHPNISYASACSGHGFKFAPAVGESVARLALGKEAHVDLEPYLLSRFQRP